MLQVVCHRFFVWIVPDLVDLVFYFGQKTFFLSRRNNRSGMLLGKIRISVRGAGNSHNFSGLRFGLLEK